ncbi:MAG TPA: ABC transporter permease [Ktedonobacterales bacterium]|nr:ABC transporter permease [Ktedonobacterales bacterium]
MTTIPTTTAHGAAAETHRALISRTPARRPGAASAALTFGWRAILKIARLPEQMADVIAIPIIFTLLFTYLFGGALAGSTSDYLRFLLPGTLVMAVLLVTINAGITLNADLATGVYDRFRSMSFWRLAPIIGGLFGDVGRYLIASALVVAMGLILGYRAAGGVAGAALAVALTLLFAFSLSWVWAAVGLIARSPAAVTSVGTVVLFPLTLASNIFVDPRTMPGWLQAFINVNPVTHLVLAVRGLMAGTATAGQIGWVLVACLALTAIFVPLTLYLYGSRR